MDTKTIGKMCADWRKSEGGYSQKQIADDLGLSPETISAFEHGRTNNAVILSWYIEHGLLSTENDFMEL